MTGKTAVRRENRQFQQQVLPVTSKCLAMIVSVVADDISINGKEVFDDFQLRNSTCYWNSALAESIRNIQYLGFLEPNTILLGGSDICLENLRMAWGRRVLNDPHNCRIHKIGDIGNIMMQEVPQNHFIPLPEILCLIILDLNNKQILATVDIIQAQLKKCYQGTQLPSYQLVYETLHTLIQERKIFHTGSGYFVVTPDTHHLSVDLPSPCIPPIHNPMYLPVSNHTTASDHVTSHPPVSNSCQISHTPTTTVAMTQTLPPMRSISCQVSIANQKRAVTPELKVADNDKPRLNRSHSARRHRDKEHKDLESIKRNASVRTQDDCLTNKDVKTIKSNLKKEKVKGEKRSLLSKLFGKKKKQEEINVRSSDEKPAVEYATFSAQFPPPEWAWYQEQCKKQERTKDWVTQQTGRTVPHLQHKQIPEKRKDLSNSPVTQFTSVSSSGLHKQNKHSHKSTVPNEKLHTYHEIESFKSCNKSKKLHQPTCVQDILPEARFYPIKESQKRPVENKARRSKSHHRKSNRHSMDVALLRRQHAQIELQQEIPNEHARVTGLSPMCSSTPRECERKNSKLGTVNYVDMCSSPILQDVDKTEREHRSHRRRSKNYRKIENDISYEYQGRLPRKHSNMAMSRDSGVNCVGLSNQTENNNFCYNQLMEYENVKSNNLHKSMEMQLNAQYPGEPSKNEIVCVAEINTCVPVNSMETKHIVKTKSMDKRGKYCIEASSRDQSKTDEIGLIDSSEQSYDTVIHNKNLQDISKETEYLTLGDSGFSSPRLNEYELDKNKNKMKMPLYKNLTYDHHELNNLKDFQKEKIVLNNEFYKEPSPSSDYQIVGVV